MASFIVTTTDGQRFVGAVYTLDHNEHHSATNDAGDLTLRLNVQRAPFIEVRTEDGSIVIPATAIVSIATA